MAEINLTTGTWMVQIVAPGAAGRFVVTDGYMRFITRGTIVRMFSGSLLANITQISFDNPTDITLDAAHGHAPGETFNVRIAGSDSTPTVDGDRVATAHASNPNIFSVPVNVTGGGVSGECVVDKGTPTGRLRATVTGSMLIPEKLLVATEQGYGIFMEGETLATSVVGELVGYDA